MNIQQQSKMDNQIEEFSGEARHRTILTKTEVLEIFRLKALVGTKGSLGSSKVAKWFGVCSKTIRDIWMGRTWYRATYHLDPARSDSMERLNKQLGRPKGSKDSRPRSRKAITKHSTFGYERTDSHIETENSSSDRQFFEEFPSNVTYGAGEFVDPFHDDWPYWKAVETFYC